MIIFYDNIDDFSILLLVLQDCQRFGDLLICFPDCYCTSSYNIRLEGRLVGAYCNKWETKDKSDWCYLIGGMNAASCPGAVKSSLGNFYWSSHKSVCG